MFRNKVVDTIFVLLVCLAMAAAFAMLIPVPQP